MNTEELKEKAVKELIDLVDEEGYLPGDYASEVINDLLAAIKPEKQEE